MKGATKWQSIGPRHQQARKRAGGVLFVGAGESMSLWCWHRWNKWQIKEEGLLRAEYDALTGRHFEEHEKFINGKFVRQQRVCEKCGKMQLRRISA